MNLENMFWIFFPPCKTFDYIVSPSTVNTLKLLLCGDEMQMMVHYLSGISVCCILFIHLAHTFIFVSCGRDFGVLRRNAGIWEIATLQGLKCSWNECSQNSLVWLSVSTSSKTKELLADFSSQGKFLWQQCYPWVSYQMCIKDQQNPVIMKIWPACASLPKGLIGIKHCWMRQLSSRLPSWKKKNNKKLKYLENAGGNLKFLELRRGIAVLWHTFEVLWHCRVDTPPVCFERKYL